MLLKWNEINNMVLNKIFPIVYFSRNYLPTTAIMTIVQLIDTDNGMDSITVARALGVEKNKKITSKFRQQR